MTKLEFLPNSQLSKGRNTAKRGKKKWFNLCHASTRGWHSLAALENTLHLKGHRLILLYIWLEASQGVTNTPISRETLGRRERICSQNSFAPGVRGGRRPGCFQRELEAAPLLSAGSCSRDEQSGCF